MRGKRSTTSPKNAVFSTTCEYAAGTERGDRGNDRSKADVTGSRGGEECEERGASEWGKKGPRSGREERRGKTSQTFFDLVVHGERVIGPHVGCNQDLPRVLQHLKDGRKRKKKRTEGDFLV